MSRRLNKKGWFSEVGFGCGYLRVYNVGETYTVSENPNLIVKQKYASRGYFAVNSSFSTGRRINLNSGSYVTPFLRLNEGVVMNYNSSFLFNISLETGLRFTFSKNPNRGKYRKIEKIKYKDKK